MGKAIQAALTAVGVTDPALQQQVMDTAQEVMPSGVVPRGRSTTRNPLSKRKRSRSTVPVNRLCRPYTEDDKVSDASNSLWDTLNIESG